MNKNKGLTQKQAEEILQKVGENTIKEKKGKSIFKKFLEQISSFLIILLILAAAMSFLIGETLDGFLILTIILLNAFFGVYQEFKAEKAVSALKDLTVSKIRVIRDGLEKKIDSVSIVPGDIVVIEEGDKIPADSKIITASSLEVNESALTGESIPVEKKQGDEVYMGTIVSKGHAILSVQKTGMQTKFGQIAYELSKVEDTLTPLQKKLAKTTKVIGIIGIILSFIVFFLSLVNGSGVFPSFLLAISLAVAVVPESLPAVMTIILSIGVKKMAEKNAVIRKLAAIEALGSTTIIATDKTGTITQNKMVVKHLYFDDRLVSEEDILNYKNSKIVSRVIENGVLCSTASLAYMPGDLHEYDVLGDPTEGALLIMAENFGVEIKTMREEHKVINEAPFDSFSKRMSIMVQRDNNQVIYSKGAPESMLKISSHILKNNKVEKMSKKDRLEIENVLDKWSTQGFRVLATSYKEVEKSDQTFQNLKDNKIDNFSEKGLIFTGMVAIYDPPRKEALEAIKKAKKAGINVVMITGDNEKTAAAIGSAVGLIDKNSTVLTGDQLENFTDEELLKHLPNVKVFARTTPFHKSRIVSLYQKLGESVTVTGDGVNDAIAIKQADVGVAMGKIGTDVARETADMVLMDDNFATIVNAIEEGRNIIFRLKKAIQYLLTGNLSEGLVLVVGLLLGLPPILIPIQLLFINLVSDGVPALAMAFNPNDKEVMSQAPVHSKNLLERREYRYILLVGIFATILVMASYYLFESQYSSGQTAAFTVIALAQAFVFVDVWFRGRVKGDSIKKYLSQVFIITALGPVILQFAIVSVPFLNEVFSVKKTSLSIFLYQVFIAFLILVALRFYRFSASLIHSQR